MARSTRQDTEKHREQIVEAAARLFRARGLDGVSIPELMAEADMTHGGFYRHFASKDALAALGYAAAFEDLLGVFEGIVAQHKDDPSAARIAYIDTYLAKSHRDKSEMGCPTAALCTDVARGDTKSELHAAFVAGARRFADRLTIRASGRDAGLISTPWRRFRLWWEPCFCPAPPRAMPSPTRFSLRRRRASPHRRRVQSLSVGASPFRLSISSTKRVKR